MEFVHGYSCQKESSILHCIAVHLGTGIVKVSHLSDTLLCWV